MRTRGRGEKRWAVSPREVRRGEKVGGGERRWVIWGDAHHDAFWPPGEVRRRSLARL